VLTLFGLLGRHADSSIFYNETTRTLYSQPFLCIWYTVDQKTAAIRDGIVLDQQSDIDIVLVGWVFLAYWI
jgi:hypothetical protein